MMELELSLELRLRSLLKEIANKLDEAKTLVAAMLITSDYNTHDLMFIENMVQEAIKKLDEAKKLVEQLDVEDDEWEEFVEVG
jgi:tetrahydromethanopterin S-methyltransferase subunit A